MTVRMMPPGTTAKAGLTAIKTNGRSQAASPGAILDVPEGDARVLAANGWLVIGVVGTTAQRPAKGMDGQASPIYIDTTISKPIWHDGVTYRDYTGTAV